MSLSIIILAAGQGRRMYSTLPKVLHQFAGKSLLEHVYATACKMDAQHIYVVHGYGSQQLLDQLSHLDVAWVEQAQQSGTGHAVQQALCNIADQDKVLVLYGDVPLISSKTLLALLKLTEDNSLALLTACLDDPSSYGRIVRDDNANVWRIVEEKDATADEKRINEVNTGIMVAKSQSLKRWVSNLDNNNAQKEFYLTDVIGMAAKEGIRINTMQPHIEVEISGVNNRAQLAELERYYQLVQAHQLMQKGITIMDPRRFDLRGDLQIEADCFIDINVILEGQLKVARGVHIGANCIIKNSVIDEGVKILPNSVIEDSVIGKHCCIGPFARIRPATVLNEDVHIGNFVEVKKSSVGKGSKINHLSYIGDSEIGVATNIGAGTITCNYDSVNKHKTIIGDDVFIGSDVQLIAPVAVSSGATVAAGTTVTKDVIEDSLAISRVEQRSLPNWKRPKNSK